MRQIFTRLIAGCLVFGGLTADAVFINGQAYTPLTEWARANGFTGFTRDHGHEINFTNRTARLVFNVDSDQSEISGVSVRLSFPVAGGKGVPMVAQLDLDKTIRPLLYPARYLKPEKITTICLDPGHGGKDTGNVVSWHKEKTYAFYLAVDVRDELKRAGFNVIFTRTKDVYVDLPSRPDYANRHGADLFVSLHFNAAQTSKNSVDGIETYCITPVGAASSNAQGEGASHSATTANRYENQSLMLAYQMEKSLVQNLGATDRSVRRARFAVLRDAAMPAILIEGGYMTNPDEGNKIYSLAYRKQMAAAIVKGILAYQRLTAPAVAPPVADKHQSADKHGGTNVRQD